MKKLILFIFSLLCFILVRAQTPYTIATDTLKLINLSGSNSNKPVIKILNRYKDSVGYVLTNIGNGNYNAQPQKKYLDSLRRSGLNIFGYKDGVATLQYTDSVGSGGGPPIANTDFLPEGVVNLYYTNARARSSITSLSPLLTYDNTTGQFDLGITGVDTANWNGKLDTSVVPGMLAPYFKQNGNTFGDTARLGTNDNFSLLFKTNNIRRGIINELGKFGIGTLSPVADLDITRTTGNSMLYVNAPAGNATLSLGTVTGSARINFDAPTATIKTSLTNFIVDQPSAMGTIGSYDWIRFTNQRHDQTTGAAAGVVFTQRFAPASGTANFTNFFITGEIDQQGGANGITRGLYISPTLTNAPDWRSIQVDAGNILFNTVSGRTAIGLNTNTPLAKLHVVGTGLFTDTIKLPNALVKTDTTANKPLVIDASGNVFKMSTWPTGSGPVVITVGARNGLSEIAGDTILFGQDSAQVGNPAALNSTREIPFNNKNLFFSGDAGKLIVGMPNSGLMNRHPRNQGRIAINDTSTRNQLFTVGRDIFNGDGITSPDRRSQSTFHLRDTITNSSVSDRIPRVADIRAYHLFPDAVTVFNQDPWQASNHTLNVEQRWMIKDTLKTYNPGADLISAIGARQRFQQYPGYVGNSTYAPQDVFFGLSNETYAALNVTNSISNNGGSNSVRIKGAVSAFVAVLIALNGRDTIDEYSPFFSGTAFISPTLKIKKNYGFKADMATFESVSDSSWGFYQTRYVGAGRTRNYFGNTTIFDDTLRTPNILLKTLDTTNYKLVVADAAGNHFKMAWQNSSGSGSPTIVTYSANQSAVVGDLNKYVFLNGTSTTVSYQINPATFTGETLRIKCINATNTVKITLTSGTIDGFSEMQLLLNDVRWVTSDGTNLYVVSN